MRVLALDYGAARCGVAVSDPTGVLATPLDPVPRPDSETGLRLLGELVHGLDVGEVVVGLPLSLSGDESEQTARARAFGEKVREAVAPVPVTLYDERLTTAQARRTGGAASEDSRAAAHLLEAVLAAREAASEREPDAPPEAG